jgi:maltooligosyltrehalose trehalohydrolase
MSQLSESRLTAGSASLERPRVTNANDTGRRFAVGAEPHGGRGTHFRVWAPDHHQLEVVERSLDDDKPGRAHALSKDAQGYFSGWVTMIGAGQLYSYRLGNDDRTYPDPASRFQPLGPHGPSQVVDAKSYRWQTAKFAGPPARGQVLYELHVGTFTKEGTYASAAKQLPELARIGITTLELMPVAEFPGQFGWGYDGVALWSPTHLYGTPDDLRRFIDTAHGLGLSVILDVVYNHLGPDGNYLDAFSPDYFTDRYPNEWGKSLNFDGERSEPVREFFAENARYWIDEFRFDGLRLDATQSIIDGSERHVIATITDAARSAARERSGQIYISAENEPQEVRMAVPSEAGGHGCDALWNDDFHHSARVALTGRREAYYHDYLGSPQELASALKWGYLYQGQHYHWQKKGRGQSALELGATSFITYIQNHDQVANSLGGDRIHQLTGPALLRAVTTLWLLSPPTPMLFQGQEFGASAPFLYFADHNPELAPLVRRGRKEFLEQFPSIAYDGAGERLDDPASRATFTRCKLDFSERESHAPLYALHTDLLALRRDDECFGAQRADWMHTSLLGPRALLLRFFHPDAHRLIVVNLGDDLRLNPAPEPLLAPRAGRRWRHLLGSEAVRYGGKGYADPHQDGIWNLTAQSASVFIEEDAAT